MLHQFFLPRRGKRLLLVTAVALAVLAVNLMHVPAVFAADQPGWSVVEASQDYCIHVNQPCSDFPHLSNLGYEEVAALNFSGKAHGKPDALILVCAHAYVAEDGHVHNLAGHVFAGPTTLHGKPLPYDGGDVDGTMRIADHATESSIHAVGSVDVRANDPVLHTEGHAEGKQITDNQKDVPLWSDIRVSISGGLEDTDVTVHQQQPTIVYGEISCHIQLPYAIGPQGIGQPPDSESVIADSDAD